MPRCRRPATRVVSRRARADETNPALSVDRKHLGTSTIGPHPARSVPAVAPRDPPRSAVACRSAIGRPILYVPSFVLGHLPRIESGDARLHRPHPRRVCVAQIIWWPHSLRERRGFSVATCSAPWFTREQTSSRLDAAVRRARRGTSSRVIWRAAEGWRMFHGVGSTPSFIWRLRGLNRRDGGGLRP